MYKYILVSYHIKEEGYTGVIYVNQAKILYASSNFKTIPTLSQILEVVLFTFEAYDNICIKFY